MSRRTSLLALAAASLLLSACGEEKVASYRVPKEKEAEMPAAAPQDGSDQSQSQAPAGAPTAGAAMADTAVPTAQGADLVWQAPADWVQKPAGQMRKATYSVPGAGAAADLSITAFPGDVGGELANVNRWRSQIGLTPLHAEDLDATVNHVSANGLDFTVVELASAGDGNGKGIIGAMVPFAGSTWFFKLSGPGASLRASKTAFLTFLRSVHAP